MPSPSAPARREIEEHEVAHLPRRSWRRWCVHGAGIAAPHRDNGEDRKGEFLRSPRTFLHGSGG
eukprot:8767490-Heterocapsa_arctica.AAC.1